MDQNFITALVTTAGTTLVAITALLLNNKRFDAIDKQFDRIDRQFDRIDKQFDRIDKRFESVEHRLDKIDHSIEMLTGTTAELDKRLSIIEDRMLNR